MATPGQPPTFSIACIDALRVEEALARIGPKWTTWTAMTLAPGERPHARPRRRCAAPLRQ